MDITLPLDQMTTAEKLRAMEAIWADLSRHADEMPLPQWHKDVLENRERLVKEGKAKFIPWEKAKKQLRKRVS